MSRIPEVRALRQQGLSYRDIGARLGISRQRAEQISKGINRSGPKHEDSETTKKRRLLRRWCRRNAAAYGLSVNAMYEAHNVGDLK